MNLFLSDSFDARFDGFGDQPSGGPVDFATLRLMIAARQAASPTARALHGTGGADAVPVAEAPAITDPRHQRLSLFAGKPGSAAHGGFVSGGPATLGENHA